MLLSLVPDRFQRVAFSALKLLPSVQQLHLLTRDFAEQRAFRSIPEAIAAALSTSLWQEVFATPEFQAFIDESLSISMETPYTSITKKGAADAYMDRLWIVPKGGPVSARFHIVRRSDVDRHLHDHPWWNISVVLRGGYFERMPANVASPRFGDDETEEVVDVWRSPGDVVFRHAHERHKLILPQGGQCLSLFITGPKTCDWGFYTPAGKILADDYLKNMREV
jgi:hypothetical protein